jgi:hypothetical protein
MLMLMLPVRRFSRYASVARQSTTETGPSTSIGYCLRRRRLLRMGMENGTLVVVRFEGRSESAV